MARHEAVELVAHGLSCDNRSCRKLFPARNAQSKVPGYYIDAERVTDAHVHRVNPVQLFFCSKECMLTAMQWQFSSLVNLRVGDRPRSDPGPEYDVTPRKIIPRSPA